MGTLNVTALPGINVDKKQVFIISPSHCPVWFLIENQIGMVCRYPGYLKGFFKGRKDIA
jgi:hypothetical protein